jgi:hypothetical protein
MLGSRAEVDASALGGLLTRSTAMLGSRAEVDASALGGLLTSGST